MGLILKAGFGIKRIVLPIGKKQFETIKELEFPYGDVEVKKTKSSIVNNNWLIDQYKFNFYNKEGDLKAFLLGNPQGEKEFYVQELRSTKSNFPSTSSPLKFLREKAKIRLSDYFNVERQKNPFSFEKGSLYIWNYTKEYLKNEGIERLLTQAECEVVDMAEITFKLGWQDVNRERKIEQYNGNINERKKNYTLTEKITGAIYLEYLLNKKK
ncbi:hypothetical protein GW931_03515 [archaeon]|nr:hypothetical protein [archaeon]PJC45390.1 MAG: hypothetical protein CO037_01735 [Candidatus Pacearchaeota archaeon CG_4_9_14_0_2_um_filter_30_8]